MAPKKEALATRNLIMARIHDILDLAQAALTNSAKVTSFKIKYRRLDQLYLDFGNIHIDIIAQISSDAELMAQDQIRKEIDNAYDQILNIYEELFPIHCTSPQSDLNAHSSSPALSVPVTVKLPTLELMKFSGDLKQWQTFIDIFNSSVHDNVYISDINKFQYLLTSLLNEPLTLVKSIPLTATNYQIAYDTLIRY